MTSRPGSDRPTPEQEGDPAGAAAGGGAVDRIVERFGGIRPMAHKLDIPVTTVQGWKKRGAIPHVRHADLRAAATRHGITLDEADLEAAAATTADDGPATDAPVIEPADPVIGAPETGSPAVSSDQPADPAKASVYDAAAEPPKTDEPVKPAVLADPIAETPRSETIRDLPPPYAEPQRSGGGFATALSLVALLVGAAALAEPWWGPRLPGWPSAGGAPATAAAPADPALRAQVQQLADRIGKLEQRPAGSGAAGPAGAATASPDAASLDAALRQLSARIDGLEKRPAASANGTAVPAQPDPRVGELADKLGGLEQRLAAVNSNTQAAQDLRRDLDAVKQQVTGVSQAVETRRDATVAAQALVLAAGQLRSSLASGQPFQQDLQAVRSLGIGDAQVTQPLDALAPYAAKGIPTQVQLADRFKPLASDIVRASNRGEGGNWIDQVTGKLATLVTVRRQGGGVVGDSADAVVARTEAALAENNLAKAVEELAALTGPAAETAAPWVVDAKARLAANQAGQRLTDRAIALLTTASGGKGAGQ